MSDCIILSGGTWSPDYFSKIKRPLGPYRLSSALEDAGYSTFVLEFSNEFTIEETLKLLSKHLDNVEFNYNKVLKEHESRKKS